MADSEIRLRLSERAFCSNASKSGNINKKRKRDCHCVMSLTSVKPNLTFPECPTTPTPLLRMAGVQRHRGPCLTFTSILPHPPRGLGASGGGARGAQGMPVRTPLWSSLGTGCSHIPGLATARVPIMSLLELQVQSWRPNETPQEHALYTVRRCSVNRRIDIRFSTNQCELSSESISNSELRKDFSSLKRR